MSSLAGKGAIVTGGAGKGLGSAISRMMIESGASVVAIDVNESRGLDLRQELSSSGSRFDFIQADLTAPDQIEAAIAGAIESLERADVLVNVVGGSRPVRFSTLTAAAMEEAFRSNLLSAALVTKSCLQHMAGNRSGSIVFISSINALVGGFGEPAYSATKAGLHSLAQTLTAEFAPMGIRANVVCAGSIYQPGGTWAERERDTPGTLAKLAALYPLRRLGSPEDVARAVLFLASDDASWISGITMPVDGGFTASGHLSGGDAWWNTLS